MTNATNAESAQTRGAGPIIASALALLLIAAIFLAAGFTRSSTVELEQILGELKPVADAQHNMEVLHLEKLKDGRWIALFGDPEDLPPAEEMGKEGGMGGMVKGRGGHGGHRRGGRMGGGMGPAKPDPDSPWLKVSDGERGHAPWQAVLVHYPSKGQAEKVLSKEFGRLEFKDLSTISKQGGSAVLDSGHALWHGFRLPFVRTRHFRMQDGQPVFHDSLRINMTRDRHALVLYLRWHPGQRGEVKTARPLLDSWTL